MWGTALWEIRDVPVHERLTFKRVPLLIMVSPEKTPAWKARHSVSAACNTSSTLRIPAKRRLLRS